MWAKNKQRTGFTIVELLIVIVIIGILAAITIVAYNGIQNRAKTSAIQADLTGNSKKIMLGAIDAGSQPTTLAVVAGGSTPIAVSPGLYNIVTYCSTGTDFVLAAQSKAGDTYYTKDNSSVINDNSINAYSPCASLNVKNTDGSAASKTYMNMATTSCATENGTCTFAGTATIAYGSSAQGKFTAQPNMASPVSCSNTTFGDPASGYTKACYVVSY